MAFRNPANGYVKRFGAVRLWYFIFGIFYLIVHGLWKELLIVFLTFGIAHLYYIFALPSAIRAKYLSEGWVET